MRNKVNGLSVKSNEQLPAPIRMYSASFGKRRPSLHCPIYPLPQVCVLRIIFKPKGACVPPVIILPWLHNGPITNECIHIITYTFVSKIPLIFLRNPRRVSILAVFERQARRSSSSASVIFLPPAHFPGNPRIPPDFPVSPCLRPCANMVLSMFQRGSR